MIELFDFAASFILTVAMAVALLLTVVITTSTLAYLPNAVRSCIEEFNVSWVWLSRLDERCTSKLNQYFTRGVILAGLLCLVTAFAMALTHDSIQMRALARGLTFGHITHPDLEPPVIINQNIRRYKLLEITSPKHVYVDLEDVATGQVYARTYVSKHCNSYASNHLGDMYNIPVTVLKKGNATWLRFDNLPKVFCE